jgi:transcription antitermination protein NusB
MSRRLTRELAFRFVFRYEFIDDPTVNDEVLKEFYDEFISSEKLDDVYFKRIVYGVLEQKDAIDCLISKYSKGWKLSRISKTDLAILRVAIYEATEMDDIPVSVAINEAIELSKIYSPEDAKAFINGVLSKVCAGRL